MFSCDPGKFLHRAGQNHTRKILLPESLSMGGTSAIQQPSNALAASLKKTNSKDPN